jgi:hypothetical protein
MTTTESELYHWLRFCSCAVEMNGPAFRMFAERAEELGKPIESLTLAEIAKLHEDTGKEYNALYS